LSSYKQKELLDRNESNRQKEKGNRKEAEQDGSRAGRKQLKQRGETHKYPPRGPKQQGAGSTGFCHFLHGTCVYPS
jgi:hypothetical protein